MFKIALFPATFVSNLSLAPIPEIKHNLKSQDDFSTAAKVYFGHPITCAVLFGLVPLLRILWLLPPALPELGLFPNLAFDISRVLSHVIIGIMLLPLVMRWFLVRNVPFVVITYLCALLISVPTEVFVRFALQPGLGGDEHPLAPLTVFILSLVLHAIVMIGVKDAVLPHLGHVPSLTPFACPVSKQRLSQPLAARINPKLSGRVVAIQARNQYVDIHTETGVHLVRLSMKAAIEKMPKNSGLRLHRSWWVCHKELAHAQFNVTDLTIKTASGKKYPVGITYADQVRQWLAAQ